MLAKIEFRSKVAYNTEHNKEHDDLIYLKKEIH